jgi:hypothetical protein
VTGRAISSAWATGIALGASVYLIFDSLGISKHPIGFGIWSGAIVVGVLLALGNKL